jgi:hypothetical protein
MKTTLLLLLTLISLNGFAQNSFSTGEQSFLNGNLKAQIDIDGNSNTTTLTLKGPSNAWFAIGFGGLRMNAGADVFMTDGTTIRDAKSTFRGTPPADASQDWTLVSNVVSGSERTIIATRANNTGDSDDYVFSPSAGSIPIIYARGSSTTYSNHGAGNRGFTTLGVTLNTKQNELLSFDISPNPASSLVNIQLPTDTETAIVNIFDYTGRLLNSKAISLTNKTINVSNLANGIYFVRIQSGNKIGSQRFIKN